MLKKNMTHYETIDQTGKPMRVCLSLPSGGGAQPTVIVMCHGTGLDAFGEDVCDWLVETGFVVAASNVFHRQPDLTDSSIKRANMINEQIVADIDITLYLLQNKNIINSDRIGILGHCMGVRMSLLGACANRHIQACVNFYGVNCMFSWGGDDPALFEWIGDIRCSVLGLFINEDENPSPADVERISAKMTRCSMKHDFHPYNGARHAFQNFLNDGRYRAEPCADAWNKTLAFLSHRPG
jgi:carboxymethylenebutenolidase